jgi:hypothetical protein
MESKTINDMFAAFISVEIVKLGITPYALAKRTNGQWHSASMLKRFLDRVPDLKLKRKQAKGIGLHNANNLLAAVHKDWSDFDSFLKMEGYYDADKNK